MCIDAGHLGGVICLDLSVDGCFLVAVGLNSHSKQLIVLWNITTLLEGDKVNTAPLLQTVWQCVMTKFETMLGGV